MLRSLVVSKASIENEEIALRRNLSTENLEESLGNGDIIWIDVNDPEDEEIEWLENTLKLHPAVVSDLKREDRRPALMVYPEYLFLSLFEPQIHLKEIRGIEIHCLISSKYFVTVRQSKTRDLFRHMYERLLRVYDAIDSQRDLSTTELI